MWGPAGFGVIDATVLSSRALQRQLRSWHRCRTRALICLRAWDNWSDQKRKGLWADTLLIDFAQLDAPA